MKHNDDAFSVGKLPYISPKAKVVFVKAQGLLCATPLGEKYSTEMEEGDDNW